MENLASNFETIEKIKMEATKMIKVSKKYDDGLAEIQSVIDGYLADGRERNIEPEQPYKGHLTSGSARSFTGILRCMQWNMEKV